MENSLKGLMLAAGIIITCIIISLGFYIAREARDTASEGTGQINQLQAEFTDASKTMYDGTEVSGSEVLNVIRKFSDETMGILVQTNKNKTYYNYNFDVDKGELGKALDNSYKNAQDVASDKYINPTARFQGSIVKWHDHRDRVRTGIVCSVHGEYKKTGGQQWKKDCRGC